MPETAHKGSGGALSGRSTPGRATPARPKSAKTPAKSAVAKKTEGPKELDMKEMRAVFDNFDVDGSGSVSTLELRTIIKRLKMDLSEAQIEAIMTEADQDGSGEIEFEEFASVVEKELSGEGGGLGDVLNQAGSMFGWLNPGSWFAPEETPTGGTEVTVARSPSPSVQRVGSRSPVSSRPQTPQLEFSKPATAQILPPSGRVPFPSPRITQLKVSQRAHQEENLDKGKEMRESHDAWKAFHDAQTDHFLYHQRRRIRQSHTQEMDAQMAVETRKVEKRDHGAVQRLDYENAWLGELDKKRAHAAKGRSRVLEAKAVKDRKTQERFIWKRDKAAEASAVAKTERAYRKEFTKSTQRAEMNAARAFTARVRHETRPAVRQEGRNLFQAQRDVIVNAERERQANDREAIATWKKTFLGDHRALRNEVKRVDAVAKASRETLGERRTREADAVRAKLNRERIRREQLDTAMTQSKKNAHDAIFDWNTASIYGYPQQV